MLWRCEEVLDFGSRADELELSIFDDVVGLDATDDEDVVGFGRA